MADIYLGSTDLSSATFYLGSSEVSALYQGSTLLYSAAPAIVPPYSPFAYYDATNTTFSSATNIQDVVTSGQTDRNFDSSASYPSYVSGEYWEFDNKRISLSTTSTTSDFLNTLGANEHTIIVLHYPFATNEEDILGNGPGNGGSILLMLLSFGVRGHAWNASAAAISDATSTTPINEWNFTSQRLEISGGNARLDLFYDPVGSLPPTKITGTPVAYSDAATSPVRLTIGDRDVSGGDPKYNGRIAQLVFYDKVLTDSEVNDVMDYMKTRQGL